MCTFTGGKEDQEGGEKFLKGAGTCVREARSHSTTQYLVSLFVNIMCTSGSDYGLGTYRMELQNEERHWCQQVELTKSYNVGSSWEGITV